MRTILLVDESDLLRVSISVDDSPHPVPTYSDLRPAVQQAGRNADAVFYVAPHHDPVVIAADGAIEGQYSWEDIGSIALMFNRSTTSSPPSRKDSPRQYESVQE
jgi:hypothetical protein